jgi:hypothetical protein
MFQLQTSYNVKRAGKMAMKALQVIVAYFNVYDKISIIIPWIGYPIVSSQNNVFVVLSYWTNENGHEGSAGDNGLF